jgi:hypothetical protein
MLVRQTTRAPVIDLYGLYACAFNFHGFSPRQIINALEAAYEVSVIFLHYGMCAARQTPERSHVAMIHVRVRDEHRVYARKLSEIERWPHKPARPYGDARYTHANPGAQNGVS